MAETGTKPQFFNIFNFATLVYPLSDPASASGPTLHTVPYVANLLWKTTECKVLAVHCPAPSSLILHAATGRAKWESHHGLFTPFVPMSHISKIISCRKTEQTGVTLLPAHCCHALNYHCVMYYFYSESGCCATRKRQLVWKPHGGQGQTQGEIRLKNQFMLRGWRVVLASPSKISSLIQISYSPCADLCYKEKKTTEQEA